MGNTLEMVERKEPEFVKFNQGDTVEGVLIGIDRIQVADSDKPNSPKRPVVKFTVETEPGASVSFLGSYDLVTKLRREDKGHMVQIRYEGEDASVSRNGNNLKRFKVLVSAKPIRTGAAINDLGITDEDIPF